MPDPVLIVVRDLTMGGIQLMAVRMLRGLPGPTRLAVLGEQRVVADVAEGDEADAVGSVSARVGAVAQVGFLRREVRRLRPRVVFPLGYSTAALTSMAVGGGVRVVAGVRNSPVEIDGGGLRGAVKRAGVRRGLRKADGVVCISAGLGRELVARGWTTPEKVSVVYNGVDAARVERLAQADSPPLPDRFVVTVGRLSAQKDVGLLLTAAAHLDVDVVVVGDGPEQDSLRRQVGAGEGVHFLGAMENPYPVMKRAAVLALSSKYEGFATVLVEAMALGVPVVAVDCPSGPREVLDGGRYGELVTTRSPAALADGLRRALDPTRNAELRALGRERASAFSLEAMVAGYAQALGLEPLDGAAQPVEE